MRAGLRLGGFLQALGWHDQLLGAVHAALIITEAFGGPAFTAGTPITLNGHPAYLQEGPTPDHVDFRSLTWSDGPKNYFVYWSGPESGQLSHEDFLKVAENLS
ncbi:hypothetical protein [Streptomyces sp. CBMA156]|uniref:hypothetical protein n=1 Tax=Streptomyces sp. CBMA156 TaxID=1930280 RepID=UPI001661FB5E|nr:hypothetical protein [Streptomyces sp. CBMA156]MBD0669197.1 hypothetical protein [Streptomyces sp. CBMA156]